MSRNIYRFLKGVSYILRWIVCYFTIGKIELFQSEFLNFVIPNGVIFSLLMSVTYFTVYLLKTRCEWMMRNYTPVLGSIAYFVLYFPYLLVVWSIMGLLSSIGLLPIH